MNTNETAAKETKETATKAQAPKPITDLSKKGSLNRPKDYQGFRLMR